MAEGTRDGEPLLRVTRGSPTDEEVAALVAVVMRLVAARRRAGAGAGPSRWVLSARATLRTGAGLGSVPARGPDAWRAAGLPAARW
ncbi:MAG TPA: acyl-CoA carboxylase subunit epsilon [Natronosporangium sp.]|nr:acyl-CoA carboxylase subunit epsilon [Natronosporangium sp.]